MARRLVDAAVSGSSCCRARRRLLSRGRRSVISEIQRIQLLSRIASSSLRGSTVSNQRNSASPVVVPHRAPLPPRRSANSGLQRLQLLSRTAAAPSTNRQPASSGFRNLNESSCCRAWQLPPPLTAFRAVLPGVSAGPVVVTHRSHLLSVRHFRWPGRLSESSCCPASRPLLSACRIPGSAVFTSCCPALWAPPLSCGDRTLDLKLRPTARPRSRKSRPVVVAHRRHLRFRVAPSAVFARHRRETSHRKWPGEAERGPRDSLVRPGFGAAGHYSQWPPPLAGRLALGCPGEIAPGLPRVRTTGSTQRASSFTVEANRVR